MVTRYSTIQSQQINALLPPEILHHVFRRLPPRDMNNVVLACRLWREVREAPGFWSWVTLSGTVSTMLESKRLKTAREVFIGTVSEKVLKAMVRHKGLIGAIPLTMDPGLLARALTRLE